MQQSFIIVTEILIWSDQNTIHPVNVMPNFYQYFREFFIKLTLIHCVLTSTFLIIFQELLPFVHIN